MGQLAIAVWTTFDRRRHMFEAEVVVEAAVDMGYVIALVRMIFL